MNDFLLGFQVLAVPVALTVAVLVLLVVDLLRPRGRAVDILAFALLAGVLGVSLASAAGVAKGGVYVRDAMTMLLERVFLAAGMLAVLGASAHVQRSFAKREAEFYALLCCSLTGMTLLAGTRDLLLLAVAFELMGIPLYVLATYAKNATPRSVEAGLKFYLVGAVSSALTLYGMSLLFGLAGTTQIADLARLTPTPLLRVAISLVVAGFGFKLGLAPFQFWIPDTYEGAPTPVASFFSVAPKAAGMMALAQLLLLGLPGQTEAWLPGLIVVAVGTMATGHLLALPQTHLKRMLGNSGVAQMGTMLLGLFAAATLGARGHGLDALLFYVVAYLAANTGLFLVVEAIGQHAPADSRDTLASLAGLHRRSPALAAAALLCLLSLAGIPFAVGFWAKLYVFLAAWQAGHTWLVLIGAGFSVLGLFYYLRVARSMYLGEPTDVSPVRVGLALRLAVAVCALATAGLGLYPRPVVEAAAVAAQAWQGQSMPRLASIPASPGTLADSPRLTQVK